MFPSTEDFEQIIKIILRTSQAYGEFSKTLRAGDIHQFIGGYPSNNHRIPNCCRAMRHLMTIDDEIIGNQNDGANFTIEYKLPKF